MCLLPHSKDIAEAGRAIYPGDEFKSGVDQATLEARHSMLYSMVKMDPRGAIISQKTMEDGLEIALKANQSYWNQFQVKSVEFELTDSEHIKWTAYRLRVAAAHLRLRYDAGAADKPGDSMLDDVFAMMKAEGKQSLKKARRVERLGERPNPFMHFRTIDLEDEVADELEEAMVIAKYFSASDFAARMVLSDGKVFLPDFYKTGSGGFAVACWLSPVQELELEVPSACVVDYKLDAALWPDPAEEEVEGEDEEEEGAEVPGAEPRRRIGKKGLRKWIKMKPAAKKRPAASKAMKAMMMKPSAAMDTEEVKQEAAMKTEVKVKSEALVKRESDQQTFARLRVAAGHGDEYTLVCFKSGDDKAQVLAVTPSQCPLGVSPLKVVQSVEKAMLKHMPPFVGKVIGSEAVKVIRQKCRSIKDRILNIE